MMPTRYREHFVLPLVLLPTDTNQLRLTSAGSNLCEATKPVTEPPNLSVKTADRNGWFMRFYGI